MQGASYSKRIRFFMDFHRACLIPLPTNTYYWHAFRRCKGSEYHCEILCRGSESRRKGVHGSPLYNRHHVQYGTMAACSRSQV